MAIKRIGHTRLPDNPDNAWSKALPGDIMHDAPGIYGEGLEEMRESPIIITEANMAPPAEHTPVTHRVNAGKTPKRTKEAVLPPSPKTSLKRRRRSPPTRTAINLRIPTALLAKYKADGPGYQTRMINVLALFFKNGGKFV